jgi:hypothetical protein
MLQFIRKSFMRRTLLLLLVLAGCFVEVDVTLAAALHTSNSVSHSHSHNYSNRMKVPRGGHGYAYANMVILIRGVAHRQLGDHFGVVGHFGGWADAGGADVADAAALGRRGES